MKVTLVLAILGFCICYTAAKAPLLHELETYSFEKYLHDFDKSYDSAEHSNRKEMFNRRLEDIIRHNKDDSKTWKKGINHMSDWTEEEFRVLLGVKKHLIAESQAKRIEPHVSDYSSLLKGLPPHVDWRDRGVVSPVKDQGHCGSCWTFATAETIESHWAITYDRLADLSEQQILDCTPNPRQCGGQGGCSGGTAELAFAQIMQMGGLTSEWTYPYRSYFGADYECVYNASATKPVANITGYVVLPSNVYEPLINAVATQGPLAISVDASAWRDYHSGVFDGCNQTHPDIDHAVQLVGYGTDIALGDYWIVRNSWTPAFGEKGYIRLKRTPKVECGMDLNPSDGTGCNGGPAQVKVCGTCGILFDVSYPVIVKN